MAGCRSSGWGGRPSASMIGSISREEKPASSAKTNRFQQSVARLTPLQTQCAPLESLEGVLPLLLRHLSLGRAQIAIDHIRGTIEANTSERIVLVTLCEAEHPSVPLAAAIAIQQSDSQSKAGCDMASLIHAGLMHDPPDPTTGRDQPRPGLTNPSQRQAMLRQLSSTLDQELATRGVRFLQWATDVSHTLDESIVVACDAFGFQSIGTLDYLSAAVANSAESPFAISEKSQLRFLPVRLGGEEFRRFAELVQATYAETLDCPGISAFRTANQTLNGYRSSTAFDSNLWFTAVDHRDQPIGCVILSRHTPAASSDSSGTPIIEIVYMGLIPEARGSGRGKTLVQHAFDAARNAQAERIILAVDQNNAPARAIYDLAGLQPLLSETVWVKLVGSDT